MLKAKAVDFFAHQSGIRDQSVAEREVVLTYALGLLADAGLSARLAFKGGTCIRKVYVGFSGRFSMDLDYTALDKQEPEDAVLDLMEAFNREFHGVAFRLDKKWRVTQGGLSFAVEPTYSHDWNEEGGFEVQVSLREKPTLTLENRPLLKQPYFDQLEFEPPEIPCLEMHEVLSEKIRAAYQRAKVRDLYDLFMFASKPFNRALVRRLAVIKLWQVRDPFNPEVLVNRLRDGLYDWKDLRRLVRQSEKLNPTEIIARCAESYSFLLNLTEEEQALALDASAHRQEELHRVLVLSCREMNGNM